MFDWNGDGKHDGQDDALLHNVINQPDKESERDIGMPGIAIQLTFPA